MGKGVQRFVSEIFAFLSNYFYGTQHCVEKKKCENIEKKCVSKNSIISKCSRDGGLGMLNSDSPRNSDKK